MRTYLGIGVIVLAGACGDAEDGAPSRGDATADETVAGEMVSQETVSQETVFEETVFEETAAEETAAEETVSVPADWVGVEVHCGYSFMAPPDVMANAAVGTDSCIDEWVASGCMHRADYGLYSSDLSEYAGQEQYAETRTTIDGRSARLLTVRTPEQGLVAAVHFSRVDDGGFVKLTVSASCDDAAAQQDALLSYQTIAFEP